MLFPDIRASGSKIKSFSRTVPHHIAPKNAVALLEQETPDFIPFTFWSVNSPHHNPCSWLHRVECASKASLSYQHLRRRRTETTNQQWPHRSESRDYWTCCWWVALAFTRLLSSWRIFWAHAVIKRYDVTRDFFSDSNCQPCLSLVG